MDIIIFSLQNLMLVDFSCQLILFIGDAIMLGTFKLGDEVLDMLVLGDKFVGHGAYGDFVLYDSHEC